MSKTSQTLMLIYDAARARFGHQGWWPATAGLDRPGRMLEICVGAILTQNTAWGNVEKAIANLKAAGCMSVPALHARNHADLAELIRPAGYFNIKARRLKNFVAGVHEYRQQATGNRKQETGNSKPVRDRSGLRGGEDGDAGNASLEAFLDRPVSALREELLAINGIGRETADSIILYAAGKPTFVVDAYTHRILLRHYLVDAEADYETIKDLVESNLPEDVELFNDFHAQFVAVGKNYCRPTARCEGCPLEHLPHDPSAGTEG